MIGYLHSVYELCIAKRAELPFWRIQMINVYVVKALMYRLIEHI